MTHHKSVNKYLSDTISANWEQTALTDFNGVSYSFRDIARKISKLHILYERCGIKPGDKVAICGRNSSNWAVAFLATMSYGAVNVPILSAALIDDIGAAFGLVLGMTGAGALVLLVSLVSAVAAVAP